MYNGRVEYGGRYRQKKMHGEQEVMGDRKKYRAR
jgi:hypothetical protein